MADKIAGRQIIWLKETNSTNEYLAREIKRDTFIENGTIVIADYQKSGRGNGKHLWESESGKNLLLSMFYKPAGMNSDRQFYLNMAVAMGVHSTIQNFVHHQKITVKWPNDLYINDKKVGGILLQHTVSGGQILYSIIGIGLNVNQMHFLSDAPNPASLKNFADDDLDLKECFSAMCYELDRYLYMLGEGEFSALKTSYLSVLYAMGELRKYWYGDETIDARITGISEYGALVLEKTDGKLITCDLGDVKFIF
jgi:BirA family transcriptional regulator, biotin operon repressor / biotin---[acetyl-CoA-carboxylase] ligase